MKFLGIALVLIGAVFAKNEQYDGWKSYYVGPPTEQQLIKLGKILFEFDIDVLSDPIVQREGLVLVKPQYQEGFVKALEAESIPYKVHSNNVKKFAKRINETLNDIDQGHFFYSTLDEEEFQFAKRKLENLARNGKTLPYNDYQEWPEIDTYLLDIAARFPDIVTLVTPANSFEGRPIRYLKISTTNFEDRTKPVIFIDGGIHAREWISPPSVTWAIHKLVEDNTDPDLLEKYDWILLPVVNPDGYQYTFTSSRFWRKTRSTNTHSWSSICPGVDGNRNYNFSWNTVGTSSTPCSDVYAGNQAFSEIETRVVRDIIEEYLPRMSLYLTMHSYGSMILYPWGHDGSLSDFSFALHTVGVAMAEAIDRVSLPNFPRYVVGNSVQVIGYPAAGASEDYAHLVGVPLSYTYELPGLSGGYDGFHLDPIYIQQVCEETWIGIVAGIRRAAAFIPRMA